MNSKLPPKSGSDICGLRPTVKVANLLWGAYALCVFRNINFIAKVSQGDALFNVSQDFLHT